MEFKLPPELERGDKIAVIRPGNGPAKTEFPEVYERGIETLKDTFGFVVVEYETCDTDTEELSMRPKKRAQDIMKAFKDPEIKGVVAAIGGTGEQVKILKYLDPEVLRENPTRFYGYSDNTSLALYLWNQGIVSFQGPMVMTELAMNGGMHHYTSRNCSRAFFQDSLHEFEASEKFTDETVEWGSGSDEKPEMEPHPGLEWHNPDQGVIEGRIWGGCLEVLEINLQIGKYIPEPDEFEGKILAIETSEEMPDAGYVKWFLMALGERGLLEKFAAVIVGLPKARHREKEPSHEEREKFRENQREVIREQVDEYTKGIPVVFNLNFGHSDPITPLPIGGKIEIDTDDRRINLPLK